MNDEKKENEKKGEFMLTPLECIIINKLIQFGIKLETEENYLKSLDYANQIKKQQEIEKRQKRKLKTIKYNTINYSNNKLNIISNNNSEKRKRIKNNTINNNQNKDSIIKKCAFFIEEIKKNPLSKFFFNTSSILPSLSLIEIMIKNKKYKKYPELQEDLRKVWNYYFNLYSSNPEMYNKTFQISYIADNIYEIVDKINFIDENNNENNNKTINFSKKENYNVQNKNKNDNTLINQNNFDFEKNMTDEEKNELGNEIRKLNKEELKGIIQILSDNYYESKTSNSQYFEFDIEKLPTKKLRELEKYVQSCKLNKNKYNENNGKRNQPSTNSSLNEESKIGKNRVHESLLSSDSESESLSY